MIHDQALSAFVHAQATSCQFLPIPGVQFEGSKCLYAAFSVFSLMYVCTRVCASAGCESSMELFLELFALLVSLG